MKFLCFFIIPAFMFSSSFAQTITIINDSTELQHFDNGYDLKVNYLLNGIPISLKDRTQLLEKETDLKQEFNIKTVSGDTIGEINFIKPGISEKKIIPKAINIFDHPIGKSFPLFAWTNLMGKEFSTENLQGKTVVLNFWHTSCVPCIAEMPLLNGLVQKYAGMNVVFIASTPNTANELQKFLAQRTFKYNQIVSIDPAGFFNPMPGWPIHIVLDGKGIIRFAVLGKQDNIEQKISNSIDETLLKSN